MAHKKGAHHAHMKKAHMHAEKARQHAEKAEHHMGEARSASAMVKAEDRVKVGRAQGGAMMRSKRK